MLEYSKSIALPVDIIVQPKAPAGAVPLAMGFDKGRCKLVLSMRGNPGAEKVLANVPADKQALLIEAMAAHELAHCWRYAQGEWHLLPAGFVETGHETSHDPELLAAAKAMRDTRREEGFADLVALAWIQRTSRENTRGCTIGCAGCAPPSRCRAAAMIRAPGSSWPGRAASSTVACRHSRPPMRCGEKACCTDD